MLDWLDEPTIAALIGMGSGAVLGAAARLGRFCTLGAIEDALYGGRLTRLRMWGIAIGVAVIAASATAPESRGTIRMVTPRIRSRNRNDGPKG